ncbi:alpha/beta fold hydrolase [Terrabacter sp. Ter38]|uniref:alpha/beta fold hydrolase n=1 Tax=Terrabacter sp. Ter38 TaxID=2926030 RepID=UPI0021190DDE|nr:alpha/beta hydrolase [Terrabacter sp. Ter38]
MSTTPDTAIPTTTSRARTASVETATGPFGRITFASMAVGVLCSAVTTFVVLPSASEARVVGAALLAFAASWGLLAWLTTRYTNRPQTWAHIPAVALAASGALMAAVNPGEPAMSRLPWVWAPAMVALGLWTGWRTRRDLPRRRARVLVYPVAAVMVVAGVGGLFQTASADPRTAAGPMPGQLVDVGGYRLHLHCTGTGTPTVVLLNGLSETSPQWSRIQPQVATTTRVCAYDRAGQGWSDDSPNQADAITAVTDLHKLLTAAGEIGPFILAGHSSGGVHALTYTHLYPAQVAGIVLLDSASPNQVKVVTTFNGEYQLARRGLAAAPTLFRFGIGRLLQTMGTPDLPGNAGQQTATFADSPRGFTGMRAEQVELPTTFAQAQSLTTLRNLPLVVLTAKANADTKPGWATAQDQMAALSTNSRHTTVDMDHVGFLHNPAGAAQSVTAITDVVTAARTHTSVPTR